MAFDPATIVNDALGLGRPADELSIGQLFARALLVYLVALFLVRAVRNRLLGRNTVFDIVLGFIFGSMLSRAINGQAPVLETIMTGAFLVGLHELFAIAGARWHWFSRWTKGKPRNLIEEGRTDWKSVRQNRLSPEDLEEAVRLKGHVLSKEEVALAQLERNGEISVVPKHRARVVEVQVAEGVQTVRIVVDS